MAANNVINNNVSTSEYENSNTVRDSRMPYQKVVHPRDILKKAYHAVENGQYNTATHLLSIYDRLVVLGAVL